MRLCLSSSLWLALPASVSVSGVDGAWWSTLPEPASCTATFVPSPFFLSAPVSFSWSEPAAAVSSRLRDLR